MNDASGGRPPDSPKTKTLPQDQRGPWFEGLDPVTGLNLYNTSIVFPVPRELRELVLGSSAECDVAVAAGFLSRRHCRLERRPSKLRIHDLESKNGTFFNGRREESFDIEPGQSFIAGGVRFVAVNDEMRDAFPTLIELLGVDDEPALTAPMFAKVPPPSEVLLAATTGRHVLITGDQGCDHLRLARAIHEISLLRGRPLVEIETIPEERSHQRAVIDRSSRSTLVITIDADTPVIDPAFGSMLFSSSYHVRVVACAPSVTDALRVFGRDHVGVMHAIPLLPLAQRRDTVLQLLDRQLEARSANIRTAQMTPANRAALQSYDWPENFDSLRLVADRVAALQREGSIRKLAEAIEMPRTTLQYWFASIGLSVPLIAGGGSEP